MGSNIDFNLINLIAGNGLFPRVYKNEVGEDLLTFYQSNGEELSINVLKMVTDGLLKTIELYEKEQRYQESAIEYNQLDYFYERDSANVEKFLLPLNDLRISEKHFKSNKWSFKCSNCSIKVSSFTSEQYYTIFPKATIDAKLERACSKDCARTLAKDIIKDWLNKNELESYFNLDTLEEQLDEMLAQV